MGKLNQKSSVLTSKIEIGLPKRLTSILNSNEIDLMNTAFYEPEFELEIELKRRLTSEKQSDAWEESLDEFTKNHPFLMKRVVPKVIELLLIMLFVVVFTKTGVSSSVDKVAGYLCYLFFACVF